MNNSTSEIIKTYAFKMGLAEGRFSYATAVGLIESIISILLILASNFACKALTKESLF
jgi:putative aldouronate transport system permease protein